MLIPIRMSDLYISFLTVPFSNCVGKFICGNTEQPEKPKFISEPFDIEVYEGTTIELPCEGRGYPKPEVSLTNS